MLLGNAPHLDQQYAIFGKVTKGDEVLSRLEDLPTHTEGMFVMPLERITILSTYYYDIREKSGGLSCEEEVESLRKRLVKANNVLEMQRIKCLP
jgi:cyclophilin family peptidyl-prolyl cis-trans isomerase